MREIVKEVSGYVLLYDRQTGTREEGVGIDIGTTMLALSSTTFFA